MIRNVKNVLVTAAALLIVTLPIGCRTAKKVVGTYDVTMAGSPDKVVAAAKAALADLKLEVFSSNATKLDGELKAKTAQGKDVVIKINSAGENVSTFSVRVGTMGDSEMSNSIIEATQNRLR